MSAPTAEHNLATQIPAPEGAGLPNFTVRPKINSSGAVEGDLLDLACEAGIVEKSGSWFSYESERIGQGREQARKFLKENPEVRSRIADAVYAARGVKRAVPALSNGGVPES